MLSSCCLVIIMSFILNKTIKGKTCLHHIRHLLMTFEPSVRPLSKDHSLQLRGCCQTTVLKVKGSRIIKLEFILTLCDIITEKCTSRIFDTVYCQISQFVATANGPI